MLRRNLLAGYLHGALLYGTVIAVVHLRHNSVASLRDAVAILIWCQLLFGIWSAALFGAGTLVARAGARFARGRSRWFADGRLLGLLGFGLTFWLPFFLHGLTYDHVPFGPPARAAGMLAYVAAAGLAILAGVVVLSRIVSAFLGAAERRGPRRLAIAGHAAALAAAVVLVLTAPASTPAAIAPPPPAPSAPPSATPGANPGALSAMGAAAADGSKVILIGLDGADWRVIEPLIAQGKLPHFAEIRRRGVAGPLHTFPDSNSSVIWASIYSGMRPETHGILDFYRIHLAGMTPGHGVFPVHRSFFKELADLLEPVGLAERVTVSRYDLDALPLWEISDHLGLTTGLVDGYYYSFPAPRPATAGSFFVAYALDGFYQQVLAGGGDARLRDHPLFVQPPELLREVKPALAEPDFFWQSAALRRLLSTRTLPRFLSFYTHEPDTVQHLFWKWYQPERFLGVRAEDIASKGGEIERLHVEFDRFLGELLAQVDETTVLMVVSDHGHAPTVLHQNYFTQHRHGPPGVLLACGGPLRAGARVDAPAVLDVFPTVLYLLGLPIPEDAAGRLLSEIVDPGYLAAHPVRTIGTYRGLWTAPLGQGQKSGLESEEIRKLRGLGYI